MSEAISRLDNLTEAEFIDLVDCQFPYDDPERCKALIDRARTISLNAMFMALHEICRVPRSMAVPVEFRKDLFTYWQAQIDHPLGAIVAPAAEALIDHALLSVQQTTDIMSAIEPYEGQYAALSIAYFSCDDLDGSLEAPHQRITDRWETLGRDTEGAR